MPCPLMDGSEVELIFIANKMIKILVCKGQLLNAFTKKLQARSPLQYGAVTSLSLVSFSEDFDLGQGADELAQ